MKLKHYLMTAAAGLMLSNAQAATFVVSNVVDGTSETLYAVNSTTLSASGVATIGYFPSGYVITGTAATDIANFTIVSSATVGGFSDDLGGSFAGYAQSAAVNVGQITTGNLLLNRPVYSFVTTNGTLAGSLNTQLVLIQVGTIGNDVPFENAYSSNPGLANPVAGYGTVGSFTGNAAGQGSFTYRTLYPTAAPVPEPSAALLGAIGALGLLRRRRN